MPRLVWTPRALNDLGRLHAFLLGRNPQAAKRAVSAIRTGVKLLRAHPEAGRRAGKRGLRHWPISFGSHGYVVLYRYEEEDVILLAVRHGREFGYEPS